MRRQCAIPVVVPGIKRRGLAVGWYGRDGVAVDLNGEIIKVPKAKMEKADLAAIGEAVKAGRESPLS